MDKKIIAFLIAFLLVLTSLGLPSIASADSQLSDNVYLIQPVDIYYNNGYIYVVDIIDDGNNTVIHRISTDLTKRESFHLNGVTKKIIVDGITVYAMQEGKILFLGIDTYAGTINKGWELSIDGLIDFAVTSTHIYALTEKNFIQYSFENQKLKTIYPNISNPKSVAFADEAVQVLFDKYHMSYTEEKGLTEPVELKNSYNGIFAMNDSYGYFDSNSIYSKDETVLLSPKEGVASLCFYNSLLILGKEKKIIQYIYQDNGFSIINDFVIGDDKVYLDIPENITGYTFAKALKYPTNILYQAAKSSRPAPYKLLTSKDTFLILHYDGMEKSDYFYVFYKGRFGWLEKAGNGVESYAVIDSSYNFMGEAVTTAYIYSLPYYDEKGTFALENVPKNTIFTIINKYDDLTESNSDWFYVSYEINGKTKYGFVRQSLIANITVAPETNVKRYTVNTDLSNQLPLYKDASLSTQLTDEQGKPLSLKSGKQVSVISIDENNVALVQVSIDNIKYIGYLDASHLIQDGLTTYVAVGLVLGIVVVLGTIFFVIMIKRRKSNIVIEKETDPFDF